jgi:hypothetical protein
MLSERRGSSRPPVRSAPVRRPRKLVMLAAAVWALAALARSAATLPDRGGRAGMAGLEPFLWLRASPEVGEIERLLARAGGRLERGTTVLVLADAGPGVDASFVWHWAQYLAPAANFVWSAEAPPDLAASWVLAWGPVAPRAEWRALAREGAATLYRVRP